MSNARVPSKLAVFNSYLNNSDDYLQATIAGSSIKNWERLGLSAQNAADWQQHRHYWRDTLYPKYSNPDLRTRTVTKEVQHFRKAFSAFAIPLLNLMVASPQVNADDAGVFNFVIKRKAATQHRLPITERCFGTFQPLGSGRIRVGFKTLTHNNRPALAKGANCVQIAFSIGEQVPTHAGEATRQEIIPRASYMLETGDNHAGQWMYIFSRWFNSKHPQLAGPWSEAVRVMVL